MKRKIFKYTFVFFSLVIMGLLFSSFNIVVKADEKITLKICGYNVSFEDSVKIEYALQTTGISDYENIVMRTYENVEDYYIDKGYTLTYLENREIGGKVYSIFIDSHIAAKQMSTDFYTYAYYIDSDNFTYGSDLVKYSVLQYAKNMKGSSKSNEELDDVLVSMLEYGARTQKYFDYKLDRLANDTYYEIKLEGGNLEDFSSHGLFKENEEVKVYSTSDEFVYWINKDTSRIYSYYNNITLKLSSDLNLKVITELPGSEGLEYSLINEGTEYEVIGIGTCQDEVIIIPKYYNGKRVTKIGDNAFKDIVDIYRVIIQSGVNEIGENAFSGCALLECIDIPQSIKTIAINSFDNCTNLTKVVMPSSFDISKVDYFDTCTNLENIYFFGAMALTNPNLSLQNYRVFLYSEEYTDDMICDNNFYWYYANYEPEIWDKESEGLGFHNEGDYYSVESEYCNDEIVYIPSFHLGKPVKELFSNAFHDNTSIKTVYLGKNIEKINGRAFDYCTNLTDVYMPESVNSIGDYCFNDCVSLKNIKLPKEIKSLGAFTFSRCNSLTNIEIPEGVTSIGNSCFFGCKTLESIVIPVSLVNVGDDAFYDSGITSIYYKGDYDDIKGITFGSGKNIFILGSVYFYNENWGYEPSNYWCYDEDGKIIVCEDDRLIFDENNECYRKNNTYGGKVVIPATHKGEKVNGIAMSAFKGDVSMTELYISEGIEYIRSNSISNCVELSGVYLPKSLKEIGSSTFRTCPKLTYIYYKGTKEEFENIEIDESSGINDLTICYYSETCPSDNENTYWHYVNGKTIIWETPNTNIDYVLIKTDTEYEAIIYAGSEEKNIFIASEKSEKDVTTLGDEIFKDKTDIEYVYLPENIKVIGDSAFKDSTSLEAISLPSTLEEIGAYAFAGTNLRDIVLPLSVKTIGEGAFDNIESLENVYYLGTEADFNKIAIGANNEDIISKVKYYQAEYKGECIDSIYWHYIDDVPTIWESSNYFVFSLNDSSNGYILVGTIDPLGSVVVIPSTYNGLPVVGIERNVIEENVAVEYVYMPDTVTSLKAYAFYRCTNLKEVKLSNNLTEIPLASFNYCENLKSIILPVSVKILDSDAIQASNAIEKLYYMGDSTEFSQIENVAKETNTLKVYYYSEEEPTTEGNYFYIVDGEAVEW